MWGISGLLLSENSLRGVSQTTPYCRVITGINWNGLSTTLRLPSKPLHWGEFCFHQIERDRRMRAILNGGEDREGQIGMCNYVAENTLIWTKARRLSPVSSFPLQSSPLVSLPVWSFLPRCPGWSCVGIQMWSLSTTTRNSTSEKTPTENFTGKIFPIVANALETV